MARRKDKRRVSKEQLALAVRKNFNGAAVNEIDVVVEMVYKVRNKGRFMNGNAISPAWRWGRGLTDSVLQTRPSECDPHLE